MASPPVAVGFDLDYTLAVTAHPRQALLDEATAAVGTHDISRQAYLDAHATDRATETRAPIFEQVLREDAEVTPEAVATAYREAIEAALEPVPGAQALIRDLRTDYRVGLLTDGPLVAQQGKLDTLGWTDLFDAVLITGALAAGKPDEGAFKRLCSALDADPGETVYVGDRPEVDVGGAAAAGLRTVQVLYPAGPDPHPDADATVERAELVERLPGMLRGR